jgi:hypothetical protein
MVAMTEIVLTSEQSQQFVGATDGIVFCDPAGHVLLRVPTAIIGDEQAIIAEAKRRLASDEPRFPFSDVLKRLKEREQAEKKTP